MGYIIEHSDCFEWLEQREPNSIHAVVTDPPFGLLEYSPDELRKLQRGRGGIWRIPPSIGGVERAPVPRFTVLDEKALDSLRVFFRRWAELTLKVLVPGAHVFVASTSYLSHIVFTAISSAGLEKRGEIMRLVRTLRGGDRPKNAEQSFAEVSVTPRSCYEPWGLFRKPFAGTVATNLTRWGTGGLRRPSPETPFSDVVPSTRTPQREKQIAPHPSLKPQRFLRHIVRASLPLASGIVLDPFCGSGSTLAAAEALGYDSIGLEINAEYAEMARKAVPALAGLATVPREESAAANSDELQRILSLGEEGADYNLPGSEGA